MKSIRIPCDDYELAADWYEGKSHELLLVIPGWSSSKKKYEDLVGTIVEQAGTSALVLDLSGHGESPFDLSERTPEQNFSELIDVYDWLAKEHPDDTINVMGTSYGGFLAAQLAGQRNINKLVLRAPAIYRPEDLSKQWKDIDRVANRKPYRYDATAIAKHPLFAEAANFKGKALVVVHEDDDIVPKVTTDAYIKAFHADKYVAKGLGHFFSSILDQPARVAEYQKAIADWLIKQ